jgi:predicted TIM-barrel fold metal-dependent hydrolase
MLSRSKEYGGGVIDAHLHLRDKPAGDGRFHAPHDEQTSEEQTGFWSAAAAVRQLLLEMDSCGVGHAVVLHLLWQPWSVEEVAQALCSQPRLTGFVNIDPRLPSALEDVRRGYELGFRGLKLHPRIQCYRPDDESCVTVVQRAGDLGMPVLLDCFPDGDWLMAGLNVLQYATLARKAPDTTVIVAHAAGHHCLDLLMLAKRVKNLWFDISYSLLYYKSPVVDSLFYALESIRYEKVLFGTDYPDRPLGISVERSLALMDKFGVAGEAREKLVWRNALELLKLKPSV